MITEIRVHTEAVTPETEPDLLDILCRIAFGMNAELAVKDIRKNPGGKYDALYGREKDEALQNGTHKPLG